MKVLLTQDLTVPKSAARAQVNREVEAFRTTYLTPGSAQSVVYSEKGAEIERYRAAVAKGETPREEDYPYAMIEARLYGMSLDNGVAFLEFFGDQWRSLAPLTEEIRRTALVGIDAARSERALADAIARLSGQLAQLKINQR